MFLLIFVYLIDLEAIFLISTDVENVSRALRQQRKQGFYLCAGKPLQLLLKAGSQAIKKRPEGAFLKSV
ncbi:hypothetical protein [Morganella morganii]|uniref:hypothetical protein n=1 Tax=Morganella morganii TaxID=582 RepID=UPI0023676138|nr:hypothetical protein [Morganella morganii]